MRARDWAALAGVAAIALAVRLAGAGDRLEADEGYSWLVASSDSAGVFFARLAEYENTPPLLYALLAPLPLDDEAWLRLPSIVAGVATVVVLFFAVRALAGRTAGLLAALIVAVAPYHLIYSNYARGFVLATFGLVLALWAVAELARGGRDRWWWLYAAGATIALYSEYYSVLALAALTGALIAAGARPWPRVAALGAAPLLTLLPFVGQIRRAADQVGVTKVAPSYPDPTPAVVRDEVVPLVFGEHGASFGGGRLTVLFAGIAVAAAATAWPAWREKRRAAVLLGGTALAIFVMHALASYAGWNLFSVRYLIALIPLAAGMVACALVSVPWRPAVPLAAVALVALGAFEFNHRFGRELEPDLAPAAAAARDSGATVVLTNSAAACFYLRDLRVHIDRPFGLGPGREGALIRRGAPYVVLDDARVGDGARPGPGTASTLSAVGGGFVIRVAAQR